MSLVFTSASDIQIASCLLYDNFLPDSARKAFSCVTSDSIYEAVDNELTIDAFHIKKSSKRGPKEDSVRKYTRFKRVLLHMKPGMTKIGACEKAGAENIKFTKLGEERKQPISAETVRREFDRLVKDIKERGKKPRNI